MGGLHTYGTWKGGVDSWWMLRVTWLCSRIEYAGHRTNVIDGENWVWAWCQRVAGGTTALRLANGHHKKSVHLGKFLQLHKPNDSPEESASEASRNLSTGHLLIKFGGAFEVKARRREKQCRTEESAVSGEIGSSTYLECLCIVRFCKSYDQIRENLLSTYLFADSLDSPRRSDGRIGTDSQSAQDVVAGQFEHHRRRYIWCACKKGLERS